MSLFCANSTLQKNYEWKRYERQGVIMWGRKGERNEKKMQTRYKGECVADWENGNQGNKKESMAKWDGIVWTRKNLCKKCKMWYVVDSIGRKRNVQEAIIWFCNTSQRARLFRVRYDCSKQTMMQGASTVEIGLPFCRWHGMIYALIAHKSILIGYIAVVVVVMVRLFICAVC